MGDRAGKKPRHAHTPRAFVRKWQLYAPPATADAHAPSAPLTFRVVSFNVLADYIVQRDGAMQGKHAWLYEWRYRRRRVLDEILSWGAPIVCLQEVDHYADFYEPEMRKAGYQGMYKKRTGDEYQDGCAIFVKNAVFRIVATHPLEYFVPGDALLDRHNIALQVVVEWLPIALNQSSRRFVIANTHLLFNPGRGDVKLAQLQRLLSSLSELRNGVHAQTQSLEQPLPLPVVLCGDFNLAPHSPLYEFLSRGELDVSGLSKHFLSGQNMDVQQKNAIFTNEQDTNRHFGHGTAVGRFDPDRANRRYLYHFPQDTRVKHVLPLMSAYAQQPDASCTGEPKFTTFHEGSKGTVDYVWFTRDALHCHGVVEMAPAPQLFHARFLPTKHHSSDHLALVADFSVL